MGQRLRMRLANLSKLAISLRHSSEQVAMMNIFRRLARVSWALLIEFSDLGFTGALAPGSWEP
jgi:hypothetical protein